ncbi:hypothetical protein N7492_008729 [Penicillium capsulatum]|uniref:F-box domain-containing protein n=1 Tax=Penicillium capsulatum TaxID=69766 RepID=A0A9W9HR96_9EURO|nr:hypothetical protein N7492_008729 [Penicillium capsulatum]KAJ6106133.1 hypothetical protein N7512_009650 [Penicillium capsulatum]
MSSQAPMPHGPVLGNEIWLIILEALDTSSLRALSGVSKSMQALCVPVLYSTIDLSIHHVASPHVSGERDYTQSDFQIVSRRQSLFMQQIFGRPELGLLVRSFTWTMGLQHLYGLPSWAQGEGTSINYEKTYQLFQSLRRVSHVDIDGGDDHDHPSPTPQNIFPEATSIRLSGQMHYALAWSILCGPEKAPLTRVELSNLIERGRFQDGGNFQPQFDPRYRVTRRVLPVEEEWSESGLPIQIAPGEMVYLLGPSFQSRCSHLYQFTVEILDLTAQHRHRILPLGWCFRLSTLHDDLTSFLQRIHPRRVEIVYSRLSPERHQELKSLFWKPHCRIVPRPSSNPQHTLLNTVYQGWPELEMLKIHGGQRGPDFPRPSEPLPSPIGRASLNQVQVCFEPEAWECYNGRMCTFNDSR